MGFLAKKKQVVQHLFPQIVGRRAEITAVKYAVKQMASRSPRVQVKDFPNIFYFYGPVGSGKTTVLKAAHQDCLNGELGFRPLCAWFDCSQVAQSEAIAIESFLLALAKALIASDRTLGKAFQPLFETWQDFQDGKLNPAPVAAGPASPAQVAVKINPVKAAYAPFSQNSVQKTAKGAPNVKAIADNISKTMDTLKRETMPKAPESQPLLLEKFAAIVDEISATQRIVFFLDNYHFFEKQDSWFRKAFVQAFERELVFVIGAESDLSKVYQAEFGNLVYAIPMMFFTVFQTEAFLRANNALSDPKLVVGTQQLTSGNPLAVSMISAAFHQLHSQPQKMLEFVGLPEEDYGDKILKYIAYIMMDEIAKGDRNLVGLLAILRQFDLNLFQSLAGVLNPARTLEGLAKKYLFVNAQGDIHDWLKTALRAYVKNDMPSLYQEINQGAYDYFTERVREYPERGELLFDSLYYYFQLDPAAAYNQFLLIISHYLSLDLDFCDKLCREVMECAIPKTMKSDIRGIARSLGYFRKKDPKESQFLLSIISGAQNEPKEDLQFLQF